MNTNNLGEIHARLEELRVAVEKQNRRRRIVEDIDKLSHDELIEVYNKVVQRLLSPE